jgi:transposase InsO family protein
LIGQQNHRDVEIVCEIKRIHAETRQTYGYRRLKIVLERNLGIAINKKRIQRIQRQHGLYAQIRRRRLSYPKPQFQVEAHKENILKRDFKSTELNKKWVTDITYIQNGSTRLYMSALMDLCNREIISYRVSNSIELPFVMETFREAFEKYYPEKVLIHSDQGGHYTSPQFCHMLKQNGAIQSMSRRGNCLDNASMENFFGHFKSELIHRLKPMKEEDLKKQIDNYIDFYNHQRIQQKMKMAPVEYRSHLFQTA